PGCLCRDVVGLEARLAVVTQQPCAARPRSGVRGVPERDQAVLRRELEDLHAAELTLARLPRDVEYEIAIADPGAPAAAEADIVQLAERLLRTRGRLQRRGEELAQHHLEEHEQETGEERNAREPCDRNAARANDGELAAARAGA